MLEEPKDRPEENFYIELFDNGTKHITEKEIVTHSDGRTAAWISVTRTQEIPSEEELEDGESEENSFEIRLLRAVPVRKNGTKIIELDGAEAVALSEILAEMTADVEPTEKPLYAKLSRVGVREKDIDEEDDGASD